MRVAVGGKKEERCMHLITHLSMEWNRCREMYSI